MTREAWTAGALASDLCAWIDRLLPDADRGERLKRAHDERFGDDGRAVSDDLCRAVEAVAHDFSRHFALEYVADGSLVPDTEPPGWPPQDPHEVQLRAGSVGQVNVLVGRSARLPPPEPGKSNTRRRADAGRCGSHHPRGRQRP